VPKPSQSQTQRVELALDIVARPSTVFKFISSPAHFKRWMGEGASVDPTPSGRVRVVYPNGDVAVGTVLELVPNKKVVFAWGYENSKNGIPPESTRLTIELEEQTNGTRVRLLHEGLPDEQSRTEHAMGWSYYTNALSYGATLEELAPKANATVEAYLEAWNEPNPGKRSSLLQQCWDDGGQYWDQYGRIAGSAALKMYIENAQRMMPNMVLERDGDIALCFERLSFAWKVRSANGQIVAQGRIFGEISIHGKLLHMVSFWGISS
jgi:uncharacterized protein YndB with AHSA1/START domain